MSVSRLVRLYVLQLNYKFWLDIATNIVLTSCDFHFESVDLNLEWKCSLLYALSSVHESVLQCAMCIPVQFNSIQMYRIESNAVHIARLHTSLSSRSEVKWI